MSQVLNKDQRLSEMVDQVASASPLYRSSNFWEALNKENLQMLSTHGLENFKRTVAQNYFNWMVIHVRDNQFRNLAKDWAKHPTIQPVLNSIEVPDLLRTTIGLERHFGWRERFIYKLFVGLLWEFMRREDQTGLADKLDEPMLGNPIVIRRNGRLISQDLANSIREFGVICEALPRAEPRGTTIAELGAGYGRLGFVALSQPNCRYLVFDVPPALYVSQWYLSRLFAGEKIFRFRRFRNYQDIREELDSSRIGFFTPDQLELFPDQVFEVFVTISTLSEMRIDQTENYLFQIERTVKDVVYLKQWADWNNVADQRRFSRADICLRGMSCVINRKDAVQNLFFEQVWKKR